MTLSNRKTGKDTKVYWIDGSGTVDISGNYRQFNVSDSFDTVDASAGADTARGMKGTLRVLGASMAALYDGTAGTAVRNRLATGNEGTLLYGLEGTAAGKPKGAFPAIVKTQNVNGSYDDMISVDFTWEPQGDYVHNPNTATW